jgi:sodium/pantothenate symporter
MSDTFWILFTFMIYFALLLVLGYVGGRSLIGLKAKDYVDQFYTAGRGLGSSLVAMILAAGLVSAGTFVGTPGLAYQKGLVWVVLTNWQNFLNLMILGVVGKKIGIIARRIDARSYLDIFGARYEDNRAVLIVSGLSLLIFLIPYASIQFVGGARLFEGLLGINYYEALTLIGAAVIAYTAFGGIKGTVLAAFVQGIVMTIAAIILFVTVVIKLGGFTMAMHAIETVNPQLTDPTAVGGIATPRWLASFAVLFGFAVLGLPHGVMPALIYKSSKAMLKALVIGAIVVTIWTVFMATTGTLAQAVNPDLKIPDKAIPTMMTWALGPVWRGIVLTGVVAALQSTVAAMVMLMSGSLVMDIYAKVFKPQATFESLRPMARWATLAIGVAAFCLAVFPPPALEWIVYFAVAGLESSLFVPLLFGLYWKRANTPGALAGMVGGLAGYILIAGYLKKLAFGMHPVIMGILISLICFMVVTYLTPSPSGHILQLYWGKERPKQMPAL